MIRSIGTEMQALNLYLCHLEENISNAFKTYPASLYELGNGDTNQSN